MHRRRRSRMKGARSPPACSPISPACAASPCPASTPTGASPRRPGPGRTPAGATTTGRRRCGFRPFSAEWRRRRPMWSSRPRTRPEPLSGPRRDHRGGPRRDGTRPRLPGAIDVDPATLSDREREEREIVRLPRTQSEALDALESDGVLGGALGETLLRSYLASGARNGRPIQRRTRNSSIRVTF